MPEEIRAGVAKATWHLSSRSPHKTLLFADEEFAPKHACLYDTDVMAETDRPEKSSGFLARNTGSNMLSGRAQESKMMLETCVVSLPPT